MAALLALANRSLPRDIMPTERDAREKWPWWKAKKWVYHIFNRLSQKYGDAKSATAQTDVAFAARWEASCAEPVLAAVLQELSAISRGEYLAERVANYVLHYVCAAVGNPKLWKLLKPHSQDIVKHALLPLLAFNQDDAELWTEDPQEYVRKGYDVIEDIYAARTAAMTLMHALCTGRKKSQLDPIMAHVVGILNEAREAAAGGQMTQQVAWRLDGALLAIGSLEGVLKVRKGERDSVGGWADVHFILSYFVLSLHYLEI
jgi:importin-7